MARMLDLLGEGGEDGHRIQRRIRVAGNKMGIGFKETVDEGFGCRERV